MASAKRGRVRSIQASPLRRARRGARRAPPGGPPSSVSSDAPCPTTRGPGPHDPRARRWRRAPPRSGPAIRASAARAASSASSRSRGSPGPGCPARALPALRAAPPLRSAPTSRSGPLRSCGPPCPAPGPSGLTARSRRAGNSPARSGSRATPSATSRSQNRRAARPVIRTALPWTRGDSIEDGATASSRQEQRHGRVRPLRPQLRRDGPQRRRPPSPSRAPAAPRPPRRAGSPAAPPTRRPWQPPVSPRQPPSPAPPVRSRSADRVRCAAVTGSSTAPTRARAPAPRPPAGNATRSARSSSREHRPQHRLRRPPA